jgi:hypothetical protein
MAAGANPPNDGKQLSNILTCHQISSAAFVFAFFMAFTLIYSFDSRETRETLLTNDTKDKRVVRRKGFGENMRLGKLAVPNGWA